MNFDLDVKYLYEEEMQLLHFLNVLDGQVEEAEFSIRGVEYEDKVRALDLIREGAKEVYEILVMEVEKRKKDGVEIVNSIAETIDDIEDFWSVPDHEYRPKFKEGLEKMKEGLKILKDKLGISEDEEDDEDDE
jgi:hypothetical protein